MSLSMQIGHVASSLRLVRSKKFHALTALFTIALLSVALLASHAQPRSYPVYGPENFTRANGHPVIETRTFSATRPGPDYLVRIHNGGRDGQFARSSSAHIKLNDRFIATPSDFNQQVQLIERPITLAATNTLQVKLSGAPGSGLTLEILDFDSDLPTITANAQPGTNLAGWNNTDVTVIFTCNDLTSGIESCTSPVAVSTDGANQAVTGTATDRAGNTATTNVTLNIDKTPPALSISSPADGTSTSATTITVAGSVSDALSGMASLTCNGAAAIRSGADFSCDLTLNEGANTIETRATDLAGNVSLASIVVTVNTNQGTVTVPDVVPLTHLAARTALTNVNLTIGAITTANSDTVPSGRVISQTPAAGASVPPRSTVALVLSLGAAGATPPISFTVDSSVTPNQTEIAPLSDGVQRRLASVVDHRGNQVDFVENELLVVTNDANAVTAFVARWQGQILRTIDPTGTRLTGLSRMHHIRINTDLADPAAFVADLRAFTTIGRGNHRVTNETGLRLLAATQMENAGGLLVTPNWMFEAADIPNRSTIEDLTTVGGAFVGPDSVPYRNDAFNWPYMNRGSVQDIGVGEAWRALSTTGRINNRVSVMVLDSGFDTTNRDFSSNRSLYGQIDQAGPGSCPRVMGPSGPCPWHGTAVVEAGMGLPDNDFGVAGPGGPVSDLILVGSPSFDLVEIANYLIGVPLSLIEGPDIINMSFGFRVPASLSIPPNTLFNGISTSFRTAGTLIVAAARNKGADVDAEDCIPDPFSEDGCIGPVWEEAAWLPCETSEVMCVGGLEWNSPNRAPNSNYGSQPDDCCTVDIYGPYTLFLHTDPSMTDPATRLSVRSLDLRDGTSYSAPFVAGVAALVWAANPDLSDGEVEDILIRTANTSSTSNVPRWVNAYQAVLEALPNDPPFISINASPGELCPPNQLTELCVSRGADIRFTATAIDNEDVRNVDISWVSDRDGPLGSGTLITRNDLSYGSHVITATVTDTTGFTNYDTLIVRVSNDQPPTLAITSPADRAVFQQGQDIPLVGTSFDPNNRPTLDLPDADVSWLLDGAPVPIASGHSATIPNGAITPGVHALQFIGIDRADGASFLAMDIVSFNVSPNGPLPGQPPTLSITNPRDGAAFVVNESNGRFGADLTLAAVAGDPEDGNILDQRFVWTTRMNSGPEETLGAGSTLMTRLFADGQGVVTTHNITVYVTDSDGNVASASISIRLTSPDADGDGLTFEQELSFGTDPDNRDTDGDGVWDGAEIVFGTDPTSATSTVTSFPNGILFGQTGRDLVALNSGTGFFGVVGQPTLLGFGMAFDETGTLFIADNDRLRIFEPFTNVNTVVGTFGAPDGDPIESAQMAYNPAEHRLYGVELNPTLNSAQGQLVRIDQVTGAAERVGTGAGVPIHAIAFRPDGVMFATVRGDATTDRFVELNPATGAIVRDIGAVGFADMFGLAFDLNGVLFASQHISGTQSRLMTIDPATGVAVAGPFVAREMFNLAVMPCAAPCLDQPPVINLPYAASETHIADLDNDSNPDIVTGNGHILMGDGTGNFTLRSTITGTHDRAAVGDLDLDGDIDVVIANRNESPQTVMVYLNDGAGNFTQAGPTYTIAGANTLIVIEIGDLNGDGLPDIAARGQFGPSAVVPYILAGLGGGMFGPPTPILTVSAGRDFALADINSDGSLDFVSTGLPGTFVFLNDGLGTFTATQLNAPVQAYGVAVGDLNGDGFKDIALAAAESRAVGVLLNNGNTTFAPMVMHDVGQLFFNVAMGDLTGDGSLDLIPSFSPALSILNNNRQGRFRRALRAPFSVFNDSAFHVSFADVDHNGWPDVIVSNVVSVTVLLNHDPF